MPGKIVRMDSSVIQHYPSKIAGMDQRDGSPRDFCYSMSSKSPCFNTIENYVPTQDLSQDQKFFLKTLEALGGTAGNKTMLDELGWNHEVYENVKSNLLAAGLIKSGRGRGGSISLRV